MILLLNLEVCTPLIHPTLNHVTKGEGASSLLPPQLHKRVAAHSCQSFAEQAHE